MMTLSEQMKWIEENFDLNATKDKREEVVSKISFMISDLARMHDALRDINPNRGPIRPYGMTRNHRSLTYKIRKLLGYENA